MKLNRKILVITKDSLGVEVSRYFTEIHPDAVERLMREAEETEHGLCAIRDCLVDDEIGWKEFFL